MLTGPPPKFHGVRDILAAAPGELSNPGGGRRGNIHDLLTAGQQP